MKHSVHVLALLAGTGLVACSNSSTTPALTTWQVTAGTSSQQEALQGLEFYPKTITVNVGDAVTWVDPTKEPHTVSFLAPGQSPPPPTDPSTQAPAGASTEDGSTFTSSGFMQTGKPYTLTFTKAGTYNYYCLIHEPEMVGTVIVNPVGTPYPSSQAQYMQQAATTETADLSAAQNALGLFPFAPNGTTVAAGISPGLAVGAPSSSTVLRFLDNDTLSSTSVTVPVGGTVTWTNESNNEPHTVTFMPSGATPPPTLSPFAPASGGTTYDGTAMVNSGVMPAGKSFTVTFTAKGTWTYYCLFHDDEGMIGTVVVQ